jgi:hypothetical protein
MARKANTTASLPGRSEELAAMQVQQQRRAQRVQGRSGKSFESLTQKQKDHLLKEVAIVLGLIDDSDDE